MKDTTNPLLTQSQDEERTKRCTRVADRAFPQSKVSWRQPGDFGRSHPKRSSHDPTTKIMDAIRARWPTGDSVYLLGAQCKPVLLDCGVRVASAIPITGYSFALDRYRGWLTNNSFQQFAAPRFVTLELEQANTQWFQSQTHRDVFVVTSGDQQNVRANVVVQVYDPLFNLRATQSELKDYTDNVSGELHRLWHPGLEVK